MLLLTNLSVRGDNGSARLVIQSVIIEKYPNTTLIGIGYRS